MAATTSSKCDKRTRIVSGVTKDPVKRRAQCRAAQARYEQTAKGKATLKRHREKRIFLSRNREIGRAKTAEEARAINAYIQQRKKGYVAQQRLKARADLEESAAHPVRAEASHRQN